MMPWLGNIYQKFENMIMEVDDTMFEETGQYLENQMQIVGESVTKFYSEVMEDLLPPSSCATPVLPIGQYANAAAIPKKSFQRSKKRMVKANTKRSTEDSSMNHDSGNSIKKSNFIWRPKQHVRSADIKLNISDDENLKNRKIPAPKTASKVALSKKDGCGSSQSCEISNVNENHEATVSKTASVEVTTFAAVADCCCETEKASSKQNCGFPVLVDSAEEKNMRSFPSDIFEDAHGFSKVKAMQPEDCSHSTIIVSHPANIDASIEQDDKTTRQDNDLKLEEVCVMVTRDELQSVPKATVNTKKREKKWLQPFSLYKKSTRKQEYEVLALLHGNNENGNGDCVESLCPTSEEDVSEPEWELLCIPR